MVKPGLFLHAAYMAASYWKIFNDRKIALIFFFFKNPVILKMGKIKAYPPELLQLLFVQREINIFYENAFFKFGKVFFQGMFSKSMYVEYF